MLAAAGCDGCASEQPQRNDSTREAATPFEPTSPEEVYAPERDGSAAALRGQRIEPAYRGDLGYDGEDVVDAQRLIYRVTLRVPTALGYPPRAIGHPSAELRVDVTRDRLRAHFTGEAWPIPEGCQVRLRGDGTGVYVFGPKGGRPLGPGELAEWFQGGPVEHTPRVRIRGPSPSEQKGPGALLCRLLAEWSNQPPDKLSRHCGDGGSVSRFRIGPWIAERTADVPVELKRNELRADHRDPPAPIATTAFKRVLGAGVIGRLEPRYQRPEGAAKRDGGPSQGLHVDNRGRSRVLVTVGGAALGWIGQGESGHFPSLNRGLYQLGAMRPFGRPAWSSKSRYLPARVVVRR